MVQKHNQIEQRQQQQNMNEKMSIQNKETEGQIRLRKMIHQHVHQYIGKNEAYLWQRIKHELVQSAIQDCRQRSITSKQQIEEAIYESLKYTMQAMKGRTKTFSDKDRKSEHQMQKEITKLKKQLKQNQERVQRRNRKITKMDNMMKSIYQKLSGGIIQITQVSKPPINSLDSQVESMKQQIAQLKQILKKKQRYLRRSIALSYLLLEKLQLHSTPKQNTVFEAERGVLNIEMPLSEEKNIQDDLTETNEKQTSKVAQFQREDKCGIPQLPTNDVSIQADQSSSYIYERDVQTQYQLPKYEQALIRGGEQIFIFPILNEDLIQEEKGIYLQIQNVDIRYQLDQIKEKLKEKEQIYRRTHSELLKLSQLNQNLQKENQQLKIHNSQLSEAIEYANSFFNGAFDKVQIPPSARLRKCQKTSNQSSKVTLLCSDHQSQFEGCWEQLKKEENNAGEADDADKDIQNNYCIKDRFFNFQMNKVVTLEDFETDEVKDQILFMQGRRQGKQNREAQNKRSDLIKCERVFKGDQKVRQRQRAIILRQNSFG